MIYTCTVLFPRVTVIPWRPDDPATYSKFFSAGSSNNIDLLEGAVNIYPIHGLPESDDCKRCSVYWASMIR